MAGKCLAMRDEVRRWVDCLALLRAQLLGTALDSNLVTHAPTRFLATTSHNRANNPERRSA